MPLTHNLTSQNELSVSLSLSELFRTESYLTSYTVYVLTVLIHYTDQRCTEIEWSTANNLINNKLNRVGKEQ